MKHKETKQHFSSSELMFKQSSITLFGSRK
jgi:hypothetical protein